MRLFADNVHLLVVCQAPEKSKRPLRPKSWVLSFWGSESDGDDRWAILEGAGLPDWVEVGQGNTAVRVGRGLLT